MKVQQNLVAIILLVFGLTACAGNSAYLKGSTLNVPIDPTIDWTAPTLSCDGFAIITSTLTYNIYAAPLPAGIPVVQVTSVPCSGMLIADKTKIAPLNSVPITALTYTTSLTNGAWQVGIEAIDSNGSQGILATSNINVLGRSGAASGITAK